MTPKAAHTIGAVKATRTSNVAQVWEGLARAHTSMAAALERDMVPEAGMALAWYEVLLHLSRAPGGMLRYQDLARVAGITNSGASRRLRTHDAQGRGGVQDRAARLSEQPRAQLRRELEARRCRADQRGLVEAPLRSFRLIREVLKQHPELLRDLRAQHAAEDRPERAVDLDVLADLRLSAHRFDSAVEAECRPRHDARLEREAAPRDDVEQAHLVMLAGSCVHDASGS